MPATHRLPERAGAQLGEAEIAGEQDGSGLRLGICCSRFNENVTRRLLEGAYEALDRLGIAPEDRLVVVVPGAFELPLAAKRLAAEHAVDAVVCLGAVIRGETSHYDFVAGQCAAGLQHVQLETGVPTVFGVLTTETLEQALDRSGGALGNKGDEAVATAVEMVNLLRRLREVGSRLAVGSRLKAT